MGNTGTLGVEHVCTSAVRCLVFVQYDIAASSLVLMYVFRARVDKINDSIIVYRYTTTPLVSRDPTLFPRLVAE